MTWTLLVVFLGPVTVLHNDYGQQRVVMAIPAFIEYDTREICLRSLADAAGITGSGGPPTVLRVCFNNQTGEVAQ